MFMFVIFIFNQKVIKLNYKTWTHKCQCFNSRHCGGDGFCYVLVSYAKLHISCVVALCGLRSGKICAILSVRLGTGGISHMFQTINRAMCLRLERSNSSSCKFEVGAYNNIIIET